MPKEGTITLKDLARDLCPPLLWNALKRIAIATR
jgi:hypothetical protein